VNMYEFAGLRGGAVRRRRGGGSIGVVVDALALLGEVSARGVSGVLRGRGNSAIITNRLYVAFLGILPTSSHGGFGVPRFQVCCRANC
jgi:hypothetical protein